VRRAIFALLVLTAVLLACRGAVVDTAELTFSLDSSGNASGFDCAPTMAGTGCVGLKCLKPGEPLADRVLPSAGGTGAVSFVVDFISTGGTPHCDPGSILQWCDSHDCSAIPGTRRCLSAALPGVDESNAEAAVSQALASQSGVVTSSAPGEPLLVRVTATALPCDQVPTEPVAGACAAELVGCAFSCPVVLSGYSGQVELDLDLGFGNLGGNAITNQICGPAVALCAQTPMTTTLSCGY
jgi:hypothetical protein